MKRTTRTTLGNAFNEGARLAWLALAVRGWSVSDLRSQMVNRAGRPLASGVLDRALYGDALPNVSVATQVDTLLGVPVAAWERKPTRPYVLPAAKRAASASRRRSTARASAA